MGKRSKKKQRLYDGVKPRPRKPNRQRVYDDDCKGKVRYRDHAEAVRALNVLKSKGDPRDKMPYRVYECEECKGWHMTSKQRWGAR